MSTVAYPIQFSADDDVRRSRLTVFFRILLLIPHFVILYVWYLVVGFVVFIAWFCALVTGRVPSGLHGFMAGYLRYSTRVTAYWFLLANPYPPFGTDGTYPVDIEVAPPESQGRLGVFFRLLLLFPCLLMVGAMNYVLFVVGFGGWWIALFTGRMPAGLMTCGQYCLRFSARTNGYALLLTSRYPVLGDPLVSDGIAPRSEGSLPQDAAALPPLP
jgi:Domain of unknown function (DUF4389)